MRALPHAAETESRRASRELTNPADVLLHYGHLAAELEDTTNPAHRAVLQQRLAKLDAWLDADEA